MAESKSITAAAPTPAQAWLALQPVDLQDPVWSSVATTPALARFFDLALPVLKRYKSCFLADTGDILMCLLIHGDNTTTSNTGNDPSLRVELCRLDDTGQLQEYARVEGGLALATLKRFVTDFPQAVLTTSARQPLCLFASNRPSSKAGPESEEPRSLGLFQGYLTWHNFQGILQQGFKGINVAVP